jgi:rhodanese-related sulfurtransferase
MVTGIDRSQLHRLIEFEGAKVVDVLPAAEYDASHLPGAINIPLKHLTAETTRMLRADDPVVVYCHDGL